jgi:hypothetical protein
VLSNTSNIAVARGGADLPRARSPLATMSGAGVNHAQAQLLSWAVVSPSTRFTARRRVPAMAQPLAVKAVALPIGIRNPYLHKTRVNAGGDGASGPHPEREPA